MRDSILEVMCSYFLNKMSIKLMRYSRKSMKGSAQRKTSYLYPHKNAKPLPQRKNLASKGN